MASGGPYVSGLGSMWDLDVCGGVEVSKVRKVDGSGSWNVHAV